MRHAVNRACVYVLIPPRFCSSLTSLSLSVILVAGWVLRPPVMFRTAPMRYHIREWGLESITLEK